MRPGACKISESLISYGLQAMGLLLCLAGLHSAFDMVIAHQRQVLIILSRGAYPVTVSGVAV